MAPPTLPPPGFDELSPDEKLEYIQALWKKLDPFKGRITLIPGATNDRQVIRSAVAGCDGVFVVLAPWGMLQGLDIPRAP